MKMNDPVTGKKNISSESIMRKLLEAADRIIDYRIAIALGQQDMFLDNFELGNKDYQQMVIDQVEPVLNAYREVKKIEANNSGAVLALLKSGKVNPAEAISLLKLIQTKLEVEEKEKEAQLKRELMASLEEEDEDVSGEDSDTESSK